MTNNHYQYRQSIGELYDIASRSVGSQQDETPAVPSPAAKFHHAGAGGGGGTAIASGEHFPPSPTAVQGSGSHTISSRRPRGYSSASFYTTDTGAEQRPLSHVRKSPSGSFVAYSDHFMLARPEPPRESNLTEPAMHAGAVEPTGAPPAAPYSYGHRTGSSTSTSGTARTSTSSISTTYSASGTLNSTNPQFPAAATHTYNTYSNPAGVHHQRRSTASSDSSVNIVPGRIPHHLHYKDRSSFVLHHSVSSPSLSALIQPEHYRPLQPLVEDIQDTPPPEEEEEAQYCHHSKKPSAKGTSTMYSTQGQYAQEDRMFFHENTSNASTVSTASANSGTVGPLDQLSRHQSVVSQANSVISSNTTASSQGGGNNSASTTPTPTSATASAKPTANPGRQIWKTFSTFSINSKPADSLMYSQTRQEAWMQYNKANTPGKSMDVIELWTIMACRFMLQTSLVFSPVGRDLHKAGPHGEPKRVLDVHGIMKAPWAWQLALDNPHAIVYGYQYDHGVGKLPMAIKDGPQNFVPLSGSSLTSLPFEDNMFDVVTCKSLWYFLQNHMWEDVLREMYRVLKPGGAIELIVCDYDVVNRSPGDEYWWSRIAEGVTKRNIDIYPSARIPRRLKAAGFTGIKRCMLAIPRGWSGQLGHLCDFLSSYYADAMFSMFGDLNAEEMKAYRAFASSDEPGNARSTQPMTMCYAIKPDPKNTH
ncbi:hypothetical protein TRVA0_008S02322 [Trichomonascus vanleenenianus]|uniref:class I SAM-dependent methyltransferase n=1 Tax=Trichomonascus vanleenenianus TaxID=2268995 RepID=UPI003EC95B4B